ncbi:MAG: transporter [Raineya sp.]|jgi:hypothetical protein|nr:transporter [Raineya sp.]
MNKLLLLFLFFLPFWSFSQDSTTYEIATDRPSVSYSAFTAPKGILIAELGYSQENRYSLKSPVYNISLRYGLTKRLEARLADEYLKSFSLLSSINPTVYYTFTPITLGLKYRINNPSHQKFALSALWGSKIPVFPTTLETNILRHFSKILFQYNITPKIYTFSNAGWSLLKIGNGESFSQFNYTLGLGANVFNGFYTYFEVFGQKYFNSFPNSDGANIGIIYIIKKRYQLDASFGGDLNQPLSDYNFFNLGLSTYLKINPK